MKRKSVCCFLFVVLFSTSSAQYKTAKEIYDHRDYIPAYDDPYNPGTCALNSLGVPGLGQIMAGETKRGIFFMGAAVTSWTIYYTATILPDLYSYNDPWKPWHDLDFPLFCTGLAGILIVHTWAFIDALHVARVNNMYWQNRKLPPLKINPSIQQLPDGSTVPAFTLVYKF